MEHRRTQHPDVQPDLIRAKLGGAFLQGANLSRANLTGADLTEAVMSGANLSWANLTEANLLRADLSCAKFEGADLSRAELREANLRWANLDRAILVECCLNQANMTGSYVYGASVWNVSLADTLQNDLVITPSHESVIQVDRLDLAQFIYLLLNSPGLRHIIDTITSKVVLILGRFTEERKAVLDGLRTALRQGEAEDYPASGSEGGRD